LGVLETGSLFSAGFFGARRVYQPILKSMDDILRALFRSLDSLKHGKVWFYIGLPAISAALVMATLAIFALGFLIAALLDYPPMTWLNAWGAFGAAKFFAALGGWILIVSASYVLAVFVTAVFTLPLMLDFLSATDYADLERRGRDNAAASVWNGVSGALLFVLGWIATLPLWLIPGFSAVLPFFWMAWLNRRTFSHDILTVFAAPDEWIALKARYSTTLLVLGFLTAALTLVPVVGLFAPSLAALIYSHFCLEALRGARKRRISSTGDDSNEIRRLDHRG
jgi:hypothetical protein